MFRIPRSSSLSLDGSLLQKIFQLQKRNYGYPFVFYTLTPPQILHHSPLKFSNFAYDINLCSPLSSFYKIKNYISYYHN